MNVSMMSIDVPLEEGSPPPGPTPSPPPDPSTLTPKDINPFGDIRLNVVTGSSSGAFRVSSHALMAASKFFRKMLEPNSNFAEAIAFREHRLMMPFPLTVHLDEHKLDAVEVILRIIHGRLRTGTAKVDELYEWALVCDYFDCGEALREWALTMVPDLGKEDYTGPLEEFDKWLYIACQFRNDGLFEMLTRFGTMNGARRKDDVGEKWAYYVYGFVGDGSKKYSKHTLKLTPVKVSKEMGETSWVIADYIVGLMKDAMKRISKNSETDTTRCKYGEPACDLLSLGILSRAYGRNSLASWVDNAHPATVQTSVKRMIVKLGLDQKKGRLALLKLQGDPVGKHKDCNPLDMILKLIEETTKVNDWGGLKLEDLGYKTKAQAADAVVVD